MQIQYVSDQSDYRAGACNIGPAEIARRRRAALVAIGAAIALAVVLVAIGAPPAMRLLVAVPLAGGLISLEQVRRRFCVAFALAGIRNFGDVGSQAAVTGAPERAADRRAALIMVGYTTAIAVAIAIWFVLLPI